jgi:hypothetical protein
MKFLRNFYIWSLMLLFPLLLGSKQGGCQFLKTIFYEQCTYSVGGYDVVFRLDGFMISIYNNGIIHIQNSLCPSAFDSILTVIGEHTLNAITQDENNPTGNIIVGDEGTLVRLTPDYQLVYPTNPAGNKDLNAVDSNDPFQHIIFAVGDSGTVIKSTDGGLNWFQLDFPNTENLECIEVENYASNIFVGGSGFTAAKSTDGGATWEIISIGDQNLEAGTSTFNDIYFYNDFIGFVGGPSGLVGRTTDGGISWTTLTIDGFVEINSFFFISPDSGIVVGSPGTARITTDSGKVWFEDPDVTTFLNGQTIKKLIPFSQHFGLAIGEGGFTLAVADDSTLLSPVEQEEKPLISYELYQNYPNPFNPSTMIRFNLPQSLFVTLKVYDVLGNKVATLIDEYKSAGSYEVEFNAGALSSGIYFYTLKAGSFTQTKKLVLLK